jgi:hypothetical protein
MVVLSLALVLLPLLLQAAVTNINDMAIIILVILFFLHPHAFCLVEKTDQSY